MNDVPVPIASNSFQIREKVHNLWNFQQLGNPKKNTVKVALETISYREPQLWNLVPSEIRILSVFQYLEKRWKIGVEEHPYRLYIFVYGHMSVDIHLCIYVYVYIHNMT